MSVLPLIIPAPATIYPLESPESVARLSWLGFSVEDVLESLQATKAFQTYTMGPSFPRFGKGAVTAYFYQALYLRLVKNSPEGTWQKKEPKGFARIDRSDGEVGIVFAKGDHNTGQKNFRPRTSTRKGKMMEMAVRLNCRQLHFRDVDAVEWPSDWPRYTWLVLHNSIDVGSGRCEISLPTSMGRDRHVNGFAERIIVADGSAEVVEVTETEEEEYPLNVSEKGDLEKIG